MHNKATKHFIVPGWEINLVDVDIDVFRAARGGGGPGVRTPHGPGGRDGRAEVPGDQGQPRPGHHLEEGGESGGREGG